MTDFAIAKLRRRELKSGLFVKLQLTVRKSYFPFLLCFKKKKGSSALAPNGSGAISLTYSVSCVGGICSVYPVVFICEIEMVKFNT